MARVLAILGVTVLVLAPALSGPAFAAESAEKRFKSSLEATAQGTGHVSTGGAALWFQGKSFTQIIGLFIRTALSFLGLFFLGLTIYGGFTWTMARGNDADVKKAQSIIEAAVIGLIIVVAAYAITVFIGNLLVSV